MVLAMVLIAAVAVPVVWLIRQGSEFAREQLALEQRMSDLSALKEKEPARTISLDQKEEDTQAELCSIEIRCDTILNHMDQLKKEKVSLVPEDGVILPVCVAEFKEGETVMDVLKRACDQTEIPLEYSWTPLYDSYYIEGIQNLYEFDCGNESGWTYKVNGEFPNYGCSSYELKSGDEIVWQYTCEGYGADVGASIAYKNSGKLYDIAICRTMY